MASITHYSGSSSGSKSSWSWRRVSSRCAPVDWPLISPFSMATARFAACCCSLVRVKDGVGGSAEGKGIMSALCQSLAL